MNDIFNTNNPENIMNNIIDKFGKKHGPKKVYKFYVAIVELFDKYPETGMKMISSFDKWGYWKDLWFILIANNKEKKNQTLNDYIYTYVINQLESDWQNYKDDKNFSNLAKWIPKQGKSFDKKLGFIKHICQKMFPYLKPLQARNAYRKMVTTLNKKLGTIEIMLCSKEFDKINFDNVPTLCLKNNMDTFLKHPESKINLQKHLFKKYISLDFKNYLDMIVFKELSEFEKRIVKDVWIMNRLDFCDQIDKIIGIKMRYTDVIIDTSKSMYDSKLINVAIGIALIAGIYKNNIIVNAHNPYNVELSSNYYDMFKNIDVISKECAFYDRINFDKILGSELVKRNNILVITDKEPPKKCVSNAKVVYWLVNNESIKTTNITNNYVIKTGNFYNIKNMKEVITNKKKDEIKNIIYYSNDFKYYWVWRMCIIVAFCLLVGYLIYTLI